MGLNSKGSSGISGKQAPRSTDQADLDGRDGIQVTALRGVTCTIFLIETVIRPACSASTDHDHADDADRAEIH